MRIDFHAARTCFEFIHKLTLVFQDIISFLVRMYQNEYMYICTKIHQYKLRRLYRREIRSILDS